MRFLALILALKLCLTGLVSAHAMSSKAADSTATYTGFAIALAWPNALAKEAGDGYDRLMRGLGFNDDGFYRVGHAAVVLINIADSSCHYFDFGRYHSPAGTGRVRSAVTDHDLKIATKAIIKGRYIDNLDDILCEVNANPSTHASGAMFASYVRIHFEQALQKAEETQQFGFLPYGPFEPEGSNCSRFVRQIILAGDPNWAHALRLKVVPMITPTTLYPVSALYHWTKVPGCVDAAAEIQKERLSALPDSVFEDVIPEPIRPDNVPIDAQWLAGESGGSWFHLVEMGNHIMLTRYSSNGTVECSVRMRPFPENEQLKLESDYRVTYGSDCRELKLDLNSRIVSIPSF